jgi:hypothetical protein
MSLLGKAALTIWHDVPAEARADYFEWQNREHMAERVGIPGFLRGRRYEAIEGSPEFFTLYEAAGMEVLKGPDYAARLNAPTPQTKRIAALLRNSVRTLCRVALSLGAGQGGLLMTWRYDVEAGRGDAQRALLERLLASVSGAPGVAGAHLCLSETAPGWVILVEGATDAADLRHACRPIYDDALVSAGAVLPIARGLYRLKYGLN